MPFNFVPLSIKDVILVIPQIFRDARGAFLETYQAPMFKENGIGWDFVQDNHSISEELGTVRGLHYQLEPYAQGKLIRVISGSICDVAVDIRQGSPTYGRWVQAFLNATNHHQLWIPPGFAHGLQTLEPNTQVCYKATASYEKNAERCILYNDSRLAIPWPIDQALVNSRDACALPLHKADNNFVYKKTPK